MGKKIYVRENTGNLENLPEHREKTGTLVCSGCKFPDSKAKRYSDICRIKIPIFFKLDKSARNFVYVIITNRIYLHKICGWTGKKQGKHREFENAI